jgi:large subunit ribosomal protein L21
MYAIIEQGGKQYKVSQGDVVNIELTEVAPDAKTIELDKVLFVADGTDIKVGTPFLEGAKVIASFKTVAEDAVIKGPKLYPMQFRRRKNSSRRVGHRQKYHQVVNDTLEAKYLTKTKIKALAV